MNAVAVELSSAPGYEPRVREADPVVAVRREAGRDEDADQAEGDAAEHRPEAIAGAEEQVASAAPGG